MVYIYTLTLTRLLVDHDYNIYCLKLIPWHHVRLVPVINSSPSLYSIHVITHSRMLSSFTRGTILLLNDDVLPTADASTECFKETHLPNGSLLPNSAHVSVASLYQFLVLIASQACIKALVLAWRGESFPHTHRWWCSHLGLVPCVLAHTPVGAGLVVRGRDLLCEAKTSRARRRLVVQGGDLSLRSLL
jgi:hypothetical protein